MKRWLPYLLVLIILSSVVALSVIMRQKKVDIDDSSASNAYAERKIKIERVYDNNEKITKKDAELIEGVPEIPMYPGLTIRDSFKKEIDGKTDYVIVWKFDGDRGQGKVIIDWFTDELTKAGWDVAGPFNYENAFDANIEAENDKYYLKILNTEENHEETRKILIAEFLEK